MSNDYTQQMLEYIMSQSQAGQPMQFGPYEGKPSGLTAEMARRMNLGQDWLSVQADSSNAALAGMAAYSPEAFQSTSTYTPVEQPGTRELTQLAQRLDTPLGMIAAGILRGSTASAEIAKLQQMYTEAEADGSLATDPLLSQIPGKPDQIDGTTMQPDWEGLSMRMNDVESSYMQEAQGAGSSAMYDVNTGEYLGGGNQQMVLDANGQPMLADVETTPSEQAQWYAEQGLSPPDQQYTPADLMDPSWQGQDQAAQQAMSQWLDSSDALSALYAQMRAEEPTGKTQFAGAAPAVPTKTNPNAASAPGGGGGGGGADLGDVATDVMHTTAPLATGSPIEMAIAAGLAAPGAAQAAGSWWGQHGGNPVDTALGAAGSFWDWYQGQSDPRATAAGGQQFSPGGAQDPFAGMTPEQQQAAVAANPALQTPEWQQLLAQSQGGAQGFMGAAGQQQLDPQTLAMVNQAAAQMTQQQPLMKQSLMLGGQMPMGGNPPQGPPPPTPSGNDPNGGFTRNEAPGAQYNAPGAMGPPMPGQQPQPPLPAPSDANTIAMLRQLMGQQALDDFENQRNQQFNQPAPQAQPSAPTPDPQQMLGILGQQPSGALGSPAWQDLLNQSLQNSSTAAQEQSMLPLSEREGMGANANGGHGPNANVQYLQNYEPPDPNLNSQGQPRQAPTEGSVNYLLKSLFSTGPWATPEHQQAVDQRQQGGGVLGIGDYLQQYVLGGGTQPHSNAAGNNIGPPPQPAYSPTSGPGADWEGVNTQRQNLQDAISQGAISSGLGFVPQGNDANTLMTMAQQSANQGRQKSWWQENMVPSWWDQNMGGGGGGGSQSSDQQVRIGSGKQTANRRTNALGGGGRSGPSKRGRPSTPATRAGWDEYWNQSRNAGQAANRAYGADYGHAAAVAYLLQQQGVTPATTQLAARRASATQLGM